MLKWITIPPAKSVVFGSDQLSKRRLVRHVLIGALLALVASSSTLGLQDQETGKSFRNLQACVGNAKKKFPDAKTDTGKLVIDIRASSNVLLDKWINGNIENVPADYLQTLQVNCDLLAQAAGETDADKARAVLEDVSADLGVKASQAKNQVGSAEGLGGSISVSVKTRRNGQEVGGYLVRCNPKRYSTQAPAMFPFNNPTNQAERNLPPGNYIFWLENSEKQIVTSRPISVGGNGQKTEPTIWFDVP